MAHVPKDITALDEYHQKVAEAIANGTSCFSIIFSHNFTKAFWGDGKLSGSTVIDGQEWETTLADGSHKYFPFKNWQYHIQRMSLEAEPLKYLQKFL